MTTDRHHYLPPITGPKQGGFSLIVSLMMLIVIIILGVSASQMAVNEERGARNDRDRQLAFQAAEAALKDAEYEILSDASPACAAAAPVGHGRLNTVTCFNEDNGLGFVTDCSAPPNEGLCLASATAVPAWLSPNVQFLADAKGTGNNHTVKYGRFTGRTFPTQATVAGSAFPIYPPRYIIERVLKNLSTDSMTQPGEGYAYMFRVTAMGFGANPNSQVVLQSVVSTLN